MNIAFCLLILIFGGLTLWLLSESLIRWFLKIAYILVFCVFVVIFWSASHTFLGWPAREADLPEVVNIHWVIIKEPSELLNEKGKIYFLLEAKEGSRISSFLRFFAYGKTAMEPRLYESSYNRKLHEQIEKEMMPQLRQGQLVRGRFEKNPGNGKGKDSGKEKGKGEGGREGKGSRDESQRQEIIFHELRPSEVQGKPH